MEGALQTQAENDQTALDDLVSPIGDQATGEDPRYGDDFNRVKQEIDRLSDTDYTEVVRLCRKILKQESKDLRVAGYLLLAKVYTEGLNGLLEGVRLYYELIKRYGIECHPQRETARIQSIAWLNNGKLLAFVNKIGISSEQEREAVSGVKAQIESLNKEIASLYGDTVTTWTSLNPWIKQHLPSQKNKTKADVAQAVEPVPNAQHDTRAISSELSFTRTVEGLLSYLAKQKDWMRLIAFSRAMKWSGLALPANESGKTQVLPPRGGVVAEMQSPFNAHQSEEKLLEIEAYFVESGCQFYFDLQKREADVAAALGRPDVVKLIENSLCQLLDREPEIVHLSFSDGTPFASEKTRRWINKTRAMKSPQTVKQTDTGELSVKISEIIESANSTDLVNSIGKLDKIDVKDLCDEFHIDLAKIDLCMAADRNDLALPLAEHLERLIEKYRLQEWQQSLALALWKRLVIILQSEHANISDEKIRINTLKGKICTKDLGFALEAF
jgi:type VI secretion system protein VasJ